MLDNIELADGFLGSLTVDGLAIAPLQFYALVRCLEIISEPSRRLSVDLKDRHPIAPWGNIAAAGNVYRHEYGIVSADAVWTTVKHDLPALRKIVLSGWSRPVIRPG